jgi:hypothetical protein
LRYGVIHSAWPQSVTLFSGTIFPRRDHELKIFYVTQTQTLKEHDLEKRFGDRCIAVLYGKQRYDRNFTVETEVVLFLDTNYT